MKFRILTAILGIALGTVAFAQTAVAVKDPAATPRIDQRQANQEKRIEQGVASGQLTPREAKRLERKEDRIAQAEQRAKADGVVSAKERKQIKKMENHAGGDIRREKHDGQRDLNHDGKRDHHDANKS